MPPSPCDLFAIDVPRCWMCPFIRHPPSHLILECIYLTSWRRRPLSRELGEEGIYRRKCAAEDILSDIRSGNRIDVICQRTRSEFNGVLGIDYASPDLPCDNFPDGSPRHLIIRVLHFSERRRRYSLNDAVHCCKRKTKAERII